MIPLPFKSEPMNIYKIILTVCAIFMIFLFWMAILGINDHIYDLEDRMVNMCLIEIVGG